MSRTLSIGNEGPRAIFLALGPIYFLPEFPLTARVGSTPVWQFNIRPSRRMRRCISLLRPAPPVRLSCDVRGGFAAARKKSADGGRRPSSPGIRERPGYVRGAPARRLQPFGPRPSTSRPVRAPPRRWPRCSACPHRPWRGACRRASSRPRWRACASPRRLFALWPGLSATSTLPCSARRPRRAAFSGACCRPWLSRRGIATRRWSARGHRHHAAKPEAAANLAKPSTSQAIETAVTASTPLRHLSASHVGFHLGCWASALTFASSAALAASASRTRTQ